MKYLIAICLFVALLSTATTSQPLNAGMFPSAQRQPASSVAKWAIIDPGSPSVEYRVLGSIFTYPELRFWGRRLGISLDALTVATIDNPNGPIFQKFHGILKRDTVVFPTFHIPNWSFLRGIRMYFVTLTWHPRRANWLHVSNRCTLDIL